MIPRLYEKTETAFTGFGIGPLSDVISCHVTEERNGEFYLEMEYPRDGHLANDLVLDRLILADPYDNATQAEPFRITQVTYDLVDNMQIYAVHISYQLTSIIIPRFSTTVSTPSAAWSAAVANVYNTNPFSFSSDITGGASRTFGAETAVSIRDLLGGMEGSFLDSFGGEFFWNRYTVNLLSARGADNGVKIAYTKNLTGLNYEIDMSEVYTAAVAFWLNEGTYKSSNLQTFANNYAYDHAIVLDASGDFDSEPTRADLNAYALAQLTQTAADPMLSLEVSFVPLWQTEEYKDFYGLEHVSLCDTVTVLYPPLNLDIKAKVVRTVYNVLADRYSELSISSVRSSLADTIYSLMKA